MFHAKLLCLAAALSMAHGACNSNLDKMYKHAKGKSQGKRPDGRCYFHVANYIDAVGYGGIQRNGFDNAIPSSYWAEAHQFADYLNQGSNAKKLGLTKKGCSNPYTCNLPKGALIVVRAGTVGTAHPTAGDIAVVGGGGSFYNGGEMSYGGSASAFGCSGSGACVIGAYVPDKCPSAISSANETDSEVEKLTLSEEFVADFFGEDEEDKLTLSEDFLADVVAVAENARDGDDDNGCDQEDANECSKKFEKAGKKCKGCDCAKKAFKSWIKCYKKSGCYQKGVCKDIRKEINKYCSGLADC